MSVSTQLNFIEQYQQKTDSGLLYADKEQQHVVQKMQLVYEKIEAFYHSSINFGIKHWIPFSLTLDQSKKTQTIQGIYLWGGVGRGKTFLLDLFFEQLSLKEKLRVHFHRFMQIVHEYIDKLGDVVAPLKQTAKHLSKKYKILCLDEIVVIDIADAMILAELFKHLTADGVTLLFTSNTSPDDLYKEGLQRARFLPTIELISNYTKVINIQGSDDYRLHALKKTKIYQLISDSSAEANMSLLFDIMSGVKLHQERHDLIINYRRIPVKKWEAGIVWFSFDILCNTHRDSSDYLHIATFFNTVIISNIYCLTGEQDDTARRFINMIDIFYDRHINLVISAQTTPDKLYSGTHLAFEFARTKSRLTEMQSLAYLSKNKVFNAMLNNNLPNSVDNKTDNRANSDINNPTRFGDWLSDKGRCSDF